MQEKTGGRISADAVARIDLATLRADDGGAGAIAVLTGLTQEMCIRDRPMLLLMYIIAFLDRANVAFAEEAFKVNYGISAAAFAFGAGLFFIGYAVFEVPSNLIMHRVGAKFWMARIMVTWGLVAVAFMFVRNETTFYLLRFLLGIAEAGFFPGVILYLTYWVPARHLSRARGIFYMGIALAGIIGSPISGGLLQMDGILGLPGVEWMFLVEGGIAVVVGVWSYFYPVSYTHLDVYKRQAVGIPCRCIKALENAFELSNCAAAAVGPKIRKPLARNKSTTPAASGCSGPTTVNAMF